MPRSEFRWLSFPTTNFPRIIIGVDNGVTPIEQMEVTITRPIEQAVNSVPGLEDVRSITSRGSADITLTFNWNVNMLETLQQVEAAISRIQSSLPATAQIQTHRMDFAIFPIIGYSLTSEKVPQTDLWEFATYEMKPRLNHLPGVASVLVQGGQEPEFHISVDPALMVRAKTGVSEILAAVNRTNVIDSPGLMTRNHQLYLGLISGQAHTNEEIGNIVVKNVNNAPVRIRDIGTVGRATAPVFTAVSANGKPAVLVSVNRQPDSNTVDVADEVRSGDGEHPSIASRRCGDAAVLRSIQYRQGIHRQCSRRDHSGTLSFGLHHLAVSARLGHGGDDRPCGSSHDGGDVHRDEAHRTEL